MPCRLQAATSASTAAVIAAEYPLAAYSSPAVARGAVGTDAIFACPALTVDQSLSRYVPTYAYEFSDENAPERYLPPVAGLPYGDGEKPVLRLQLFLRPRAPDGDAPDQRGPAPAQQLVGVDREVCPGERSETQVSDARRGRAVVVRERARMGSIQRAGAQALLFVCCHPDPRRREDAV